METLSAVLDDQILVVSLNNPKNGNSFGLCEAVLLEKILKDNEGRFSSLLFLSIVPRFFCTGGNLKFYAQLKTAKQGLEANRRISKVLSVLSSLQVPTAAVVNGDCFGGGIEILSCFDRVYSTPKSFFGLWQRRVALTFGWGGGARLLRRLNHCELTSLALEARSVSAYEAKGLGLVDEVVLPEEALERAKLWLKKLSTGTQAPVKGFKIFSPKKEKKIFEKLWHNKEHLQVLEKFNKRSQ